MAKFVTSKPSMSNSLLILNDDRTTQLGITEKYDLKVWPVTNILNDGPINFVVPPQSKGMMEDIYIHTKIKIQKNGEDINERMKDLSVVNNFANSLWSGLSIELDDRIDITQSKARAYCYSTFFNHALNSDPDRVDYLLYNEMFLMDVARTKVMEEEARDFWIWNHKIDRQLIDLIPDYSDKEKKIKNTSAAKRKILEDAKMEIWQHGPEDTSSLVDLLNAKIIGQGYDRQDEKILSLLDDIWIPNKVNPSSAERSKWILNGQSISLCSKLQCPLFNSKKSLPTNMKIRLSLTKNDSKFLLLSNSDSDYNVFIEDCFLTVTYERPRDEYLLELEKEIIKNPVPYTIQNPEIIVKPIPNAGQIIRVTDIFHDKLPPFAFFCLQNSKDFEGTYQSNPYVFIPFKTFQFFIDGAPYFKDPLEVANVTQLGLHHYEYTEFGDYLRQLYKTIGKDLKGGALINSKNFQLNFMVGMSFGADKCPINAGHLNLQQKASTFLEIDLGISEGIPQDMVLIVYALHDRQILIDAERKIQIIE